MTTTAKTPRRPQVTIDESPSPTAELTRQVTQPHTVTDARGRAIVLTKPSVLAQFRIIEVVGPERAQNPVYMQMIMPLIFVSEVAGVPVYFPASFIELEAIITSLDEDGISAVMTGVMQHFSEPNPEATKAAIKK